MIENLGVGPAGQTVVCDFNVSGGDRNPVNFDSGYSLALYQSGTTTAAGSGSVTANATPLSTGRYGYTLVYPTAAGTYEVVITAGTAGSGAISYVGTVLCRFTVGTITALLSVGTGAGQISLSSGKVSANITQVGGTNISGGVVPASVAAGKCADALQAVTMLAALAGSVVDQATVQAAISAGVPFGIVLSTPAYYISVGLLDGNGNLTFLRNGSPFLAFDVANNWWYFSSPLPGPGTPPLYTSATLLGTYTGTPTLYQPSPAPITLSAAASAVAALEPLVASGLMPETVNTSKLIFDAGNYLEVDVYKWLTAAPGSNPATALQAVAALVSNLVANVLAISVTGGASGTYLATGAVINGQPVWSSGPQYSLSYTGSTWQITGPAPNNWTWQNGSSSPVGSYTPVGGAPGNPVAAWQLLLPSDTTIAGDVLSTLQSTDGANALGNAALAAIQSTPGQQAARDAMKLAPTAGAAAAGSVDANIGAIAATVSTSPIQVKNLIDGGGAMTIAEGTDYPAGRAICFGVPASFMSLAGSTPSLEFSALSGGVPAQQPLLAIAGTIQTGSITINGQTYTTWLQFTPTATETGDLTNLTPNVYVYRVRCYWYNSATPPAVTQIIEVVSQSPCTATW